MQNLLDKLNPSQQKAVTHTQGPLLVLAGAGSGKTRVLTYRVAYLIKECGVPPYMILAITFTNKAANEMKERLVQILGDDGERVWARTFHSACVRILRQEIDAIGYGRNFNILDAADAERLVKECVSELNLDEKAFAPKIVIPVISDAKDNMLSPGDFLKRFGNDYRYKNIGRIYELYQKKLKIQNALDFDDLITLTVKLFEENPSILEKYQNRFRYILVDEYQDTNNSQYRLIKLLSQKYQNIFVVGDDDQSIYKFRGANIRNILDFEKDFPNAEVVKLEQNYRSTQNILDAANAIIQNNKGRKGKRLWTQNGQGNKITLYTAFDEFDEARFVSDKILELVERGKTYKDIAILYRTNAQSRVLEESLTHSAIPYRVLSGIRFYDRKEIKDVISYLRLIKNTDDDLALKRIINEPKRSIGKTTVDKLVLLAARYQISMFEALKRDEILESLQRAAGKLVEFRDMILSLKEMVNKVSVEELLKQTLEKSGYLQMLQESNDPDDMDRISNINELINGAAKFDETSDDPTFENYMDQISLVSDIDNYDDAQDTVVLMTIHSAKGLEFPCVFLCGMEEGLFPSLKSLLEEDGLEEERRLCYVAITRAKEELFISHAKSRLVFGKTEKSRVSQFVKEIPDGLLNKESAYEETPAVKVYDFTKPQPSAFTSSLLNMAKKEKKDFEFNFKKGDYVEHTKFGKGIILEITPVGNDYHLQIAFDEVGTKNLMAAYAVDKLKKI